MKLIDVLVKDLPKSGGWITGATMAYRYSTSGTIIFSHDRVSLDSTVEVVTREQYEAAISKPRLISTGKNTATLEQFINAGWTGTQLIEYGYFRHANPGEKVEDLPGLSCEAIPKPTLKHSAHTFLEKGVQHMKDRAVQRDSEDGERSMKACVDAFNAMFGHNLTETQGWQFMVLLKMARSRNKFNPDDYEDGAAYTGLAGEAHSNEQN